VSYLQVTSWYWYYIVCSTGRY